MNQDKIIAITKNYVNNFNTYLAVGTDNGAMPLSLTDKFKRVYVFESNPNKAKNVTGTVKLFEYQLSNKEALVQLYDINTSWLIEQKTLDSFNINNIDLFIISDGDNLSEVIEGSLQTINRCKPVILFPNQEEFTVRECLNWLEELGYKIKRFKQEVLAYHG